MAAAVDEETGAEVAVRALVRVHVEWALSRPTALRLIQRELLDNAERVGAARALPLAGFVSTAREIIERARKAGVLADGSPETILTILLGALSYAVVVRPTFEPMLGAALPPRDEWLSSVADDLLGLLLKRTPKRR